MIVVVEGMSAAGKTTWCRQAAGDTLLPETFPADRHNQPLEGPEVAAYWVEWNTQRWRNALALEASKGMAVCDTDPLKLHYSWGLWQLGEKQEADWQFSLQETRRAIAQRQLGFADMVLVKPIDASTARHQMETDITRTRARFDLHFRLQRFLIEWYSALEAVFPTRVKWGLPKDFKIPPVTVNPGRYDLKAFDAFIASLPKPLSS